ncbi:MAG: hypothetical protein JSV63_04185 [Candidatus Aenigmatarchaeota archaeon]|nr:MAG: hypothetical protein JSV63_04185 [Candidatus Aenigmarchaeota archaeon]
MNGKILAIAPVLLALFVSGCTTQSGGIADAVTSFEECAAAGNPVMESYPRQCRTPDGTLFVEEIDEPLIGGERDDRGCLGPAGYRWDDVVEACTRSWELDDDQRDAASIAVEYAGSGYATTIIEVTAGECEGCYTVKIEQGEERTPVTVNIVGWEVESEN